MHKTIYIDIDEEITSVLDKIRDEKSSEICIVVPKNAALTQGIINLKLLKKESAKYGKTIVIATNDPQARKVIKRLEIKTQEIAETDLKGSSELKKVEKTEKETEPMEIQEEANNQTEELKGEIKMTKEEFVTSDIGSETFFDGIIPEPIIDDKKENNIKSDIKKQEPNLISPNELREELYPRKTDFKNEKVPQIKQKKNKETVSASLEEMSDLKPVTTVDKQNDLIKRVDTMDRQAKTVRKITPSEGKNSSEANPAMKTIPRGGKTVVSRSVDFGDKMQESKKGPSNGRVLATSFDLQKQSSEGGDFKVTEELNLKSFDEETSKKAEEFFGIEPKKPKESIKEMKKQVKRVEKEIVQSKNQKGFIRRWGFAIMIAFSFVGIGGFTAWGYMNYPQAEIKIHPRKKDFSKEIKISVKEGADKSGFEKGVIPGQYKEMTVQKTMKFNATGETYATDDGKAKGKVTIYNKYSKKEQPLVATTRVLSKEGKLFRLIKGVTVPGMENDNPGTVEAAVIADKPGEEFNIGSSAFTIEGFKGKPQYDKFEVKSFEPMTDGGSPDSNKKLSMISIADIARAREKTITALEKSLEEEVKAQLGVEMSAMFDSVEKEIIGASSTNEVKDVVKSFSYTVEQKIKLITFLTADVNSAVLLGMRQDVEDGYEIEESESNVTFKKSITDLEKKTMTMYLDSSATAWPIIEAEQLAQSIAEKKEEEIRVILLGYPTIEKIEFLVKPSWLTGLPISKDKIDVSVVK
ncbi:hypothetical protein HN784_03370 [bacterium]|jgi:hypothetical protein|nr:hypothetical protein [bacterium]MBT4251335.1 hypothetical protein [bacterium]MBT4598284.1 hypothetical protein [bacterium]MBT6754117.1 hypothetical protein [bacterium]MBT7037937.1 hypothetical protein [bacterium]